MPKVNVKLLPEVRAIRDRRYPWDNCAVCGTRIRKGEKFYRCKIDAGKYQTPELDEAVSAVHQRCMEDKIITGEAKLTKTAMEWLYASKRAKKLVDSMDRGKVRKIREAQPISETLPEIGPKGGELCLRIWIQETGPGQ